MSHCLLVLTETEDDLQLVREGKLPAECTDPIADPVPSALLE